MNKPMVYVASPYTKGDPCINTNFQMRVFDQMLSDGIVTPYVPLWSHFQHTAFPRPYQDWIQYDNAIIPRLDALVRLDAVAPGYFERESSGADREVELARSLGLPVFFSIEELYEWARGLPR